MQSAQKKTFSKIFMPAGALVIALLFICLLYSLQTAGVGARVYSPAVYSVNDAGVPVMVFKNSSDLYHFYKSLRVRGRILVNFGSFLNFVGVESGDVFENMDSFPVKRINIMSEYEKRLTVRNFLWIAMQGNIIREIDYVLPDAVFEEKLRTAGGERDVLEATPDRIITHEWGSKRILSNQIADIDEPVLLNIDASFFSAEDAAALLQKLKKASLKTDVITLNLSEDNPDVSEREREELRKFAVMLQRSVDDHR